MMNHLATACLIYISLVLQSCVASDLEFQSFRPWFPGIVLAVCVVIHDDVAGVVWAGILGLAVDGLAAERLGVHLVVTTLTAVSLLMTRQETRSNLTVLLGGFVFAGTSIWKLASMTTHAILAGRDMNFQEYLTFAFGDGLYSTMMTVAVALFIRMVSQALGRRETSTSIALKNRWAMLAR